jgi:large subunit ribosomal protein L11
MAKKVVALIKLAIPAGKANPAPPIGPALGQHGVNIMAFCKEYNAKTADKAGSLFRSKSQCLRTGVSLSSSKLRRLQFLIKKAIGIEKGSGEPNRAKVGTITRAQLKEIAETKMPDLNANDIEAAMKIVEGTARNMGVTISG